MLDSPYFSPDIFKFLRDIKKNNNREWFQTNKDRFENDVRTPVLNFIEDFSAPLEKISAHYVADPKKSGGSMFRIFRDVRFSKDKSPYKTNIGAQFRHVRAKDAHAPGFYLHIEPGNVFMVAGMWRPDGEALAKIRSAIDLETTRWKRITSAKKLRDAVSFEGASLKRPPKGFDADHPLIDDLKRKDFIVLANASEKDLMSLAFMNTFTSFCRTTSPYIKFLVEAVGLEW